MTPFAYHRATDRADALHAIALGDAQFIAGGTNLLDLMKEGVARPKRLVDITGLALDTVEDTPSGGLMIGALVRNADLAWHDAVRERYPLLSQALLAGASPQLRNAATTGGNLMQRTRCHYFYDIATPCNKREPHTGCSAIGGVNRIHAILGASEHCIATHPSDMCVALAALDAVVHVSGHDGPREIAMSGFHRLPGEAPEIDTMLGQGELITGVELPPRGFVAQHAYIKVRDRRSYAFALVSVAAALETVDGVVTEARVALGGVAHKPWRRTEAESLLIGRAPTAAAFEQVAEAVLEGALAQSENGFKIPLAKRTIVRALQRASGVEEMSL